MFYAATPKGGRATTAARSDVYRAVMPNLSCTLGEKKAATFEVAALFVRACTAGGL
jgi:hypothetical protein